MRTVYLGTSEFAAAVLRVLAATSHRPALVVTRPDRPRGRGRRMQAPPVGDAARELDLPVAQPESVNGEAARAEIDAAEPDAVIVCAFGALIREPLLSAHPILNVHPSLLPRWRGAAPIERAIMAGDTRTGVSIMRLTAGLDSGPVCLWGEEPIKPADTYGTLAERLQRLGARLLVRALDERPPCHEQPEDGVSYAEKIESAERELDPSRAAPILERTVRALDPHIGAFCALGDGTRLRVREASLCEAPSGLAPGELGELDGVPVLGCGEGALALLVVQPAGRRAMSGPEFLRGRHGPGPRS